MDTWPDPKGLLERVNGVGYRDCLHNKQISHQRPVSYTHLDVYKRQEKVYYGEITAEAAAQELFEEGNRIMREAAAQ